MRILKSFDTKTDAEELMEAVEKYGEGNVVLVKRHRVKLVVPLLLVLLSIFLLNLMLYVIYLHIYDEDKVFFRILSIFYTYTTISRSIYTILGIMMNIIGQIQAKKKYIESIEKAELKQKLFEKFLKRTFITFAIHTFVLIFNATIPFIVINSTGLGSISAAVGALLIDIAFLFVVNRVMYWLIEYEMNFNICTTDSFTSYRQDGFFKTDSMNIATSAIKVIQASSKGIKGALLQYGNLYIYTDGDLNEKGGKNLELSYIPDPKRLQKKLNSMIEKGIIR